MLHSVDFARFLVSRASSLGVELEETRLHKLLYLCDGYMLAGGVNFIREWARAWNYGPVYPQVRAWLAANPGALTAAQPCDSKALAAIDKINARPLVDKVLAAWGNETAAALTAWSQHPGSPWEQAIGRGRSINSPISKEDMARYFQKMAAPGKTKKTKSTKRMKRTKKIPDEFIEKIEKIEKISLDRACALAGKRRRLRLSFWNNWYMVITHPSLIIMYHLLLVLAIICGVSWYIGTPAARGTFHGFKVLMSYLGTVILSRIFTLFSERRAKNRKRAGNEEF